jgi:DNA-directed RNA polymerase III subunit RPC1
MPGRIVDEAAGVRIKGVSFSLLSAEEISSISIHKLSSKDLYDIQTRLPLADGPLDLRLGVGNKRDKCATCGEGLTTCVGHFGEVVLALPVYNVGVIRQTLAVLSCICKSCGAILLNDRKKLLYRSEVRSTKHGSAMTAFLRRVVAECKKASACFKCQGRNGAVKKLFGFRITHHRDEDKCVEEINPLVALNLFKMVREEDYELLGLSASPERLVIQNVVVPPPCIRPSVSMEDEGTNEDDITIKISEIIHTNRLLREGIEKGNPLGFISEDWDHLQLQCALLINSELPQINLPSQPIRGIVQRLKGKAGRFRCNLSGKRVDFSGRTVISPDPNLGIEEVGMPENMARVLTIPEKVTGSNRERLQTLVMNGPENYPGANYIVGERFKRYLLYGKRDAELREGEVVERHILDGDLVLFNRQPSLHRMSIMAHKVRIHKDKTLKFNECVCGPYNADFDGDEMNIHVPQTEEARAEASVLMAVPNNIVTPRHGEPIVAATQDFITALYLITSKDTFYDRERFGQLASYFSRSRVSVRPAILRPVELFTGKQLIEALIRDALCGGALGVSLEGRNRTFKGEDAMNDGFFVIVDGSYLFGRIDKSIVGGENKKDSLLYALLKRSNDACVTAMNSITRLCSRILGEVGFSMGFNDVRPGPFLQQRKEEIVREGYAECDSKHGKPGAVELEITGVLNKIREKCGSICIRELSRFNAPNIMQACGSKGSKINVSQMVACVGQQIVSGARIPSGLSGRCLPHFEKGSASPQSRGFVRNSFYSGLDPTEFFFHAVSGREGLVDTAVKTAETGYMQRRLMKALEDLSVQYDYTVRNSAMEIVQFKYGEDKVDPLLLEGEHVVDFERAFLDARAIFMDLVQQDPTILDTERLGASEGSSGGFEMGFHPPMGTHEERNMTETLKSHVSEFVLRPEIQKYASSIINVKFLNALWAFVDGKRHDPSFYNGRLYIDVENKRLLSIFLSLLSSKIVSFVVEPGTTVGAIAAQSIGEPGTQMTLKTFHFAGVASMNITLGVPRLKEIINAVHSISTPIIRAALETPDLPTARRAKGRIDKVYLRDICSSITEVIDKNEVALVVKISLESIERLSLGLDAKKIHRALGLSEQSKVVDEETIRISLKKVGEQSYFSLQRIKKKIQETPVSGIPTVGRVVIHNDRGVHSLVIEGEGLLRVINTEGVEGRSTVGNSIAETYAVLGIEAARTQIISEIEYTIENHGIRIDPRHIMLLSDTMTYKGEVHGITRFGISKMSGSTLMLASFEQTSEHLFDAAMYGKSDPVAGVSESIILGVPISVGTGCIELYWKEAPG